MKKIYTLFTFLVLSFLAQAQQGILDTTFGNGGIVTTTISPEYNTSNAVAIQSDGKIIACGESGPISTRDITVTRYNEDGSLDNTFGTGGIAVISASAFKDFGFAVAIQTDGKIVIGGYIFDGSATDVLLIRLNTNGMPDSTFGSNGIVISDINGVDQIAESIALQDDGKILLGGYHNDRFMVLRYNTDGTLDNTFGTGGMATADVGISVCYVKSIALQDDGKIVAGGMGFNGNSNYACAMARFNSNGSLDSTFADNGTKSFNIGNGNDFITALAVQSDGKIVAGGHTWIANQPVLQYDFFATRLNLDGTLDNSFGDQGATSLNIIYGANYVTGIALQTDEKVILSGYTANGNDYNLAIARLTTDGTLDTEFGTDGITTTDAAGNPDYANAVVLQSDGKIVIAGYTFDSEDSSQFLIVRYDNITIGTPEQEMVEFNVYPNPASSYLNFKLPDASTQYRIDIIDITGKRVYSSEVMQTGKINISELTTGTYFIKLNSAKTSGAKGFIKE